MLNDSANVLIFSFVAGLSTILGVYLVRRFENLAKKNTIFLISFAIGVLFASAFFHLIPEAIKLSSTWFYWTLGAIIFFFLLEHLIIIHTCQEEKCQKENGGEEGRIHALGITSFLGIVFHSLIDGVIIGVGFEVSFIVGLVTSLAVIFHETAEGVFIYTLLINNKIFQKKALILSWIVAISTPVGAISAFLLIRNASPIVLSWLLAVAAGSFIYIGASDLVPETHKNYNLLNVPLIILGVAFVVAINQFLS